VGKDEGILPLARQGCRPSIRGQAPRHKKGKFKKKSVRCLVFFIFFSAVFLEDLNLE
jgi:hypothetical protein